MKVRAFLFSGHLSLEIDRLEGTFPVLASNVIQNYATAGEHPGDAKGSLLTAFARHDFSPKSDGHLGPRPDIAVCYFTEKVFK